MSKNRLHFECKPNGFSLIELVIVLLVISILAVVLITFSRPSLYDADQQAQTVINVFNEARARAVAQKEPMRVEINRVDRTIRIIEENEPDDPTDDVEIVKRSLKNASIVVFNKAPDNVPSNPDELTPVPTIVFKKSLHPTSIDQDVATRRFLKNGKVTDAGSSATASGAVVTGATVYFWTPTDGTNTKASIIRAVTLLGSSGNLRLWKCPVVNNECTTWVK